MHRCMATLLSTDTGNRPALKGLTVRSGQDAHEGVARVQHVLTHDDRGFCCIAARHSLDEIGMLRVRGLRAARRSCVRRNGKRRTLS